MTVQSYNDTNTQDDRFAIQMEVDELLKEIDRIATDTEFNTIKVLQGNREIVTTELVEPSEEYSTKTYTYLSQKKFPDWVSYDSKLTLNNQKVSGQNIQDTSQYVIFNQNGASNPNQPSTAYGPKPSSQDKIDQDGWQDVWTEKLGDNYSAAVDFSKIADLTTKDELYEYLGDLAGTGIGYECYTCERTQGVCFETNELRVNSVHNAERSSDFPKVNLNKCGEIDCFEMVDNIPDLMEQAVFEALTAEEKATMGITETNYNDYEKNIAASVQKAAKTIAESIVNEVIKQTQYGDHFIRTLRDKEKPYQVVFYDFRDDKAPADKLEGDVLNMVTMKVTSKVMVKNNPIELTSIEEEGYWIQAGANSFQGILIDFPDTRLSAIGMEDYNVFPYGYCSATKDKTYDPDLLIGAEKIGDHLYRGEVGGEKGTVVEETHTETVTENVPIYTTKTIPGRPAGTDKNGEYVPAKPSVTYNIITGTQSVTYQRTYTTKTIVGGTPGKIMDFYAYEPDTLLRVDHAINSLSKSRSYLGAVFNRLDHAYLNDTNAAENLQSAESRIRDEDMAVGMVALARDNILEQAGISMLAQANQMSQGILQLLR